MDTKYYHVKWWLFMAVFLFMLFSYKHLALGQDANHNSSPSDFPEIISEAHLRYAKSIDTFDVQSFLVSQNSALANLSIVVNGNIIHFSELLEGMSREHGINPRVLLVLIQIRTGAISESSMSNLPGVLIGPENPRNPLLETDLEIAWATNLLSSELEKAKWGTESLSINYGNDIFLEMLKKTNPSSYSVYKLASEWNINDWYERITDEDQGFRSIYQQWFGDPLDYPSFLDPIETQASSSWLFPYSGNMYYTGGPHAYGWPNYAKICEKLLISEASALDFAKGTGEHVLAIDAGEIVSAMDRGGTAMHVVVVKHDSGIASMYIHMQSHNSLLRQGMRIPRGFYLGKEGDPPGDMLSHLHVELRQGGVDDWWGDNSGVPVSWEGLSINRWSIGMHKLINDPLNGFAYQGSAVEGEGKPVELQTACSEQHANTNVSTAYPIDVTVESNTIDARTVFAGRDAEGNQRMLQSLNQEIGAKLEDHYAPVLYQDTSKSNERADYLANIDFDGNWVSNDNWENQENTDFQLAGNVYFSKVETDTHWFVLYMTYHPRQWSDNCTNTICYENDMEGSIFAVRKLPDLEYGELEFIISKTNDEWMAYTQDQLNFDNDSPILYSEAYLHGLSAWNGDEFPGGDGIIYYYSGIGEQPDSGDDRSVGYTLRPIEQLWNRRYCSGESKLFYNDQGDFSRGHFFDGDNWGGRLGQTPWVWIDGQPFRDPVAFFKSHFSSEQLGIFSENYVDNPYENDDLVGSAIDKGLCFLSLQPSKGHWSENVGITSLAALTYLNAGYKIGDPDVKQAVDYIVSYRQSTSPLIGAICGDCSHATYETSLALLTLKASHAITFTDVISSAKGWLINSQWDDSSLWWPVTENNWQWGGFGYGNNTRPDLSNTQFALLALNAADLSATDPTWTKAVKFVSRCQNRTEYNDGYSPGNDGGFIYYPGWSAAGGTVSTGSMTGAGIWGLALSGQTTDDERFEAALDWVSENYTWEYNPLTDGSWEDNSLYYYYLSMSKALSMARKLTITTPDGQSRDWYSQLKTKVESLQDPDQGFWVNSNSYLWENVPDLATSYALLALQTRQLPFGADLEMAIILHSPADLHMYDAYGRHVGKNYETGQVDLQIPGAEYLLSDPHIITVTPPVAGNYRVEMIGTQDGNWDLEIMGKQDDALVSYDIYSGIITPDEIKASDLNVGAFDGALTIFSTSPDNTPVIKLDSSRLDLRGYPGKRIQTSINIADAAGLDVPIKDISILPTTLKNESGVSIPVVITPTNIVSIPVGGSQAVDLFIEVSDQPLGIYRGMMTIESLNAGVRSVEINLDIRELTPMYLPVLTNRLLIGFDSQFNSSAQGWEVHSGSWNVDENYYSTIGVEQSWASTSYVGAFTNFDYQIRMQRSGCLECSNGIIVRGEPVPFGSESRWHSGYGFYIDRNSRYSIFKYVDGNAYMLQDWTVSQSVNPGDDWNTLRLVANGETMSFFVNGSWIWTGSDSSYNAGRVGIAMYRKVDSTGDYLQVDWAKLNPISTTEAQAFSRQSVNNVNDDLERLDDRFAP